MCNSLVNLIIKMKTAVLYAVVDAQGNISIMISINKEPTSACATRKVRAGFFFPSSKSKV